MKLELQPAAAVVVVCLAILLLVSGAFWAGRMVEQRSELGKLLVYAPAVEDVRAATHAADSAAMQFMLACRLHKP